MKQQFKAADEVKVGNNGHTMTVEDYIPDTGEYLCMWIEGKSKKVVRRERFAAALLQPANVMRYDQIPIAASNMTISNGEVRAKRIF